MALQQKNIETKRILLCVSGLSPQIVTEIFYALAVTQKNKWVPIGCISFLIKLITQFLRHPQIMRCLQGQPAAGFASKVPLQP